MAYAYKLKKTYSFQVYPSAVLGHAFRDVTVLGILDYTTAMRIKNIRDKHPLYYPYLPSGTPDSPEDYTYLRVMLADGTEDIIAAEWIRESTITETDKGGCTVRFSSFDFTQLATLQEVLEANGFSGFTITTTRS